MRSAFALLALLLAPATALAVEPPARRPPVAARARTVVPSRARAARMAPPPPPVALQLGGLRVLSGAPWRGVLHALARDAWPALVRCSGTTPLPTRRGVTTVTLHEQRGGAAVTLAGGPLARDPALRQCLERALAPVHLPPGAADAPEHEEDVRFELVFGLPALGGPRR